MQGDRIESNGNCAYAACVSTTDRSDRAGNKPVVGMATTIDNRQSPIDGAGMPPRI